MCCISKPRPFIGLYSLLERLGFESGGEFTAAIEQGTGVGAVVLPADQPIDEMWRHLAEAIRGTGVRGLVKCVKLSLSEDNDNRQKSKLSMKERFTATLVRYGVYMVLSGMHLHPNTSWS
jgi:pheromone shutdown protein TraB